MFEIVITEKVIQEEPAGQEWKVIGETPLTKEEVDKAFGIFDANKTNMKELYGYTPKIMKPKEVTIEILRQNVERLNLIDIICAINGIEKRLPGKRI